MELDTSGSAGSDTELSSHTESASTDLSTTPEEGLSQIQELEKLEKFRFQGRDYTAKELEKEILFQKDWTKKSQQLAQEKKEFESARKAVQEEQKFESNLKADLDFIKANPQHAAKFLEVYPAKYHQALQQVMSEINGQQQQSHNQQKTPSYETLALQREVGELRSYHNESKITVETQRIEGMIKSLESKYPDAITEMAIGRVYSAWDKMVKESGNESVKIPDQVWEDTFKSVASEMKQLVKTKYSANVKQQLQANSKAKGTPSGGANVGRAPQKFKNLRDVTNNAIKGLQRG